MKNVRFQNIYVRVIRDYLIIFEEEDSNIYILNIWDSRQDPDKLDELLS